MVTDDERRRVAAALREYASFDCEDEGEEECLVDCADWGERVLNLLGCWDTEVECYEALADLIDPTCVAHRDQLFYPATDLTPEYEETIYRCGSCDEIVSYDDDYDPETDAPAYCEMCGSRITGIGEPWDE